MDGLKRGAVYDVGGALAMYWPDEHPCGSGFQIKPWLVLHPWGGTEWTDELREGARYLGQMPGTFASQREKT